MSEQPASDELDGIRIRRLAAERRAAYRARSHCIIGAAACFVLELQLVWMLWRRSSTAFGPWAFAYYATAVLAAAGVLYFSRRAMQLHREANRRVLDEPVTPPDFSTLSDGSQRWKNLDDIHD
jgi:hypothetical protein